MAAKVNGLEFLNHLMNAWGLDPHKKARGITIQATCDDVATLLVEYVVGHDGTRITEAFHIERLCSVDEGQATACRCGHGWADHETGGGRCRCCSAIVQAVEGLVKVKWLEAWPPQITDCLNFQRVGGDHA